MTNKAEYLAEQQPRSEKRVSSKTKVIVLNLEDDSSAVPLCLEGVIYTQVNLWPSNSSSEASWLKSIKLGISSILAEAYCWDHAAWASAGISVVFNKRIMKQAWLLKSTLLVVSSLRKSVCLCTYLHSLRYYF